MRKQRLLESDAILSYRITLQAGQCARRCAGLDHEGIRLAHGKGHAAAIRHVISTPRQPFPAIQSSGQLRALHNFQNGGN
jgi:hypothetical protein